ncbi:hypothetical protein [Liquorilactobacillus satsumensis]|uniref:hypothetical protein n=1 Tax=Liquorilactobacillus satsumensis TaxID=259059 RepID=UPI0039EBFCBC
MPRTKVFVWQMVSVIFAAICVFVLYNAILLPGKYQNAKLYLLDPLTNLALMLVAILTLLVCYHGLRKLTIRRINFANEHTYTGIFMAIIFDYQFQG